MWLQMTGEDGAGRRGFFTFKESLPRVAQAGPELFTLLRAALNFRPSFLHPTSAGITGLCHYDQVMGHLEPGALLNAGQALYQLSHSLRPGCFLTVRQEDY